MRRRPFCLLLLSAAIFAAPIHNSVRAQANSKRDAATTVAVRAVLDAQVEAWNRGDIEAFMGGYARSPDITFISGDNFTRGWQTVHDRYQKNYNSREKMGTLTFSDLETRVESSDSAVTIGRWHLQLANDQPHGRFTLVFRRTRQGWRIVHDHTSSAP
jgi:uncharacterized protein (TIGR02246 family)